MIPLLWAIFYVNECSMPGRTVQATEGIINLNKLISCQYWGKIYLVEIQCLVTINNTHQPPQSLPSHIQHKRSTISKKTYTHTYIHTYILTCTRACARERARTHAHTHTHISLMQHLSINGCIWNMSGTIDCSTQLGQRNISKKSTYKIYVGKTMK